MDNKEIQASLKRFVSQSAFLEKGGVFADVDGTLLYEFQGAFHIPSEVQDGIKRICDLGRPIILNTLRFPLSIIRTFGPELYRIIENPIPVVLLNGSMTGYIKKNSQGDLFFEEIESYILEEQQIEKLILTIDQFVQAGITDISLFYYPQDWQLGEMIWTANPESIEKLKGLYTSASSVISTDTKTLEKELKNHKPCMMLFLIDADDEKLMAYQHTKKNMYFVKEGVDKSHGAKQIAQVLGISLKDSVGAGDTELDVFLKEVGLALKVGKIPYKGIIETIEVVHPSMVGECLKALSDSYGKETKHN